MIEKIVDIRAERRIYNGNRIAVLITSGCPTPGMYRAAVPLFFKEVENNSYVEPTMSLEPETAQQLMDELWRCGIRPTEGSGSAGSLAATERHLKDMQAIAFGILRQHGTV